MQPSQLSVTSQVRAASRFYYLCSKTLDQYRLIGSDVEKLLKICADYVMTKHRFSQKLKTKKAHTMNLSFCFSQLRHWRHINLEKYVKH